MLTECQYGYLVTVFFLTRERLQRLHWEILRKFYPHGIYALNPIKFYGLLGWMNTTTSLVTIFTTITTTTSIPPVFVIRDS